MAVGIFRASGNHREARMHCVQEIRHRGFLAAVMTYFQNVGLQHLHIVFGKNLALRSFFRIAGQEKLRSPKRTRKTSESSFLADGATSSATI